jgi:integrase
LLLVGFAGAFRASELVGLDVVDVSFTSAGAIVKLKKSKTDQEGRGRTVLIPFGKGDQWTCPVRMLRLWLKRTGIQSGAIFRRVDRNQKVVGERLSAQVVSITVKKLVEKLGRDTTEYSGHSLRAGFVTSAAKAGVPIWKIRQQTGHKSDLMVQLYVRPTNLLADQAFFSLL